MHQKMDNIKIIGLLLTMLWTQTLMSQTGCSGLLSEASQAYNDGKFEKVVELLNDNINTCDFDKLELEQATKLLSSSYIKLDEIELSEALVFNLLKKNPTYQVQNTIDPQPFVEMLKKFDRTPRAKIGCSLGRYQPLVQPVKSYSVLNVKNYTSEYTTQSNISFSIYAQYLLNKTLSLTVAPFFTQIKFDEKISYTDMVSLVYSESSNYLKLPISIDCKVYQKKNFSASVSAGVYGSITGKTQSELSYQIPNNGEFNATGFDNLQRSKYNSGYQMGINLEYIKNRFCFNGQVNYSKDFGLYNQQDASYSNNSLLTDYHYTSDDLKMSHLDLKIGVSYIFSYKIKHKYHSK